MHGYYGGLAVQEGVGEGNLSGIHVARWEIKLLLPTQTRAEPYIVYSTQ